LGPARTKKKGRRKVGAKKKKTTGTQSTGGKEVGSKASEYLSNSKTEKERKRRRKAYQEDSPGKGGQGRKKATGRKLKKKVFGSTVDGEISAWTSSKRVRHELSWKNPMGKGKGSRKRRRREGN